MKKLDKDTALAKISVIINDFYSKVGREIIDDVDIAREQLIEDIEGILEQVDIKTKNIIVEKLEIDNEVKKDLKYKW